MRKWHYIWWCMYRQRGHLGTQQRDCKSLPLLWLWTTFKARYSWKILTWKQMTASPWTLNSNERDHQCRHLVEKLLCPKKTHFLDWITLSLCHCWWGSVGEQHCQLNSSFLSFSQKKERTEMKGVGREDELLYFIHKDIFSFDKYNLTKT